MSSNCSFLSRSHAPANMSIIARPEISQIRPQGITRLLRLQPRHQSGAVTATSSVATPRRSGNYKPTIWDYNYIKSLTVSDEEECGGRLQSLQDAVRRLFPEATDPIVKLELLDDLRQLGIGYHFEEEIHEALAFLSKSREQVLVRGDLQSTALLFRLFRENGVEVSQDVFRSFLDDTYGGFKDHLCHDTEALLSLYEASYLGFPGESILDEANAFTTQNLTRQVESMNLDSKLLREKVMHALDLPLHWRMSRLQAQWFIDVYTGESTSNPDVLELAKIDYNRVQAVHKREVSESTSWWTDLGLGERLTFARDRIVGSHLWTVGIVFEPKFSRSRSRLTQAVSILTVIDDVYDVYGSLDELKLFTKAVERWDIHAIVHLPDYMKICFLALFNSVNESTYEILKEKGVDIGLHLRKLWTDLCMSYLQEAMWYHNKHTPTMNEYMANATKSIAGHLAISYIYFFIDQDMAMEVLDHLESCPELIKWSNVIFRLTDDMSTSDTEMERGDVAKAVECYMSQETVSRAAARNYIGSMIADSWKKINRDRFASSVLPKYVVDATLDMCRTAHSIYLYGDGHGFPDGKRKEIKALLFEAIPH